MCGTNAGPEKRARKPAISSASRLSSRASSVSQRAKPKSSAGICMFTSPIHGASQRCTPCVKLMFRGKGTLTMLRKARVLAVCAWLLASACGGDGGAGIAPIGGDPPGDGDGDGDGDP